MEDFLLTAIVPELAQQLVGRPLGRIFSPSALEFALGWRQGDALYISVNPTRPAIFSTERSFKTWESGTISNFVQLLRKYLAGATLTGLHKEPQERRIFLEFQGFDVAEQPLKLTLMLDFTGRSANAYLFINQAFLSSLRELPNDNVPSLAPLAAASGAQLLAATTIAPQLFDQLCQQESVATVAKRLRGFSPTLTQELVVRSQQAPTPSAALASLMQDLSQLQPRIYAPSAIIKESIEHLPLMTFTPRRNFLLSSIKLSSAAGLQTNTFPSLSLAADSYYNLLQQAEWLQRERQRVLTKVRNELSHLATIAAKLHQESQNFANAEQERQLGDLILANLGTLRRADQNLVLIDFFHPDQPEITVAIADRETPQQLAAKYFKQYQKARRGQQEIDKRLKQLNKQIAQQQYYLQQLEAITTIAELRETLSRLFPELAAKLFAPITASSAAQKQRERAATTSLPAVRRYLSSDGFEILVGRSDASNDQLTFQVAKSSDIWLHAADYPGPHVLIRNPERRMIPQLTLQEAAQLAAFFSKARGETQAAVRYTERKHISRPKKAQPGMVLMTQFKTLMVRPQEAAKRVQEQN
jgi:predicted ribosome quality control (RQC) complex YloA/Tae2 family protein